MRQSLLILLVLTATGCQSSRGGLGYRKPDRPDDPMYSIEEQQRRGRETIATIEDSSGVAPKTYVDRPGVGR